jgi:hypothetical protein
MNRWVKIKRICVLLILIFVSINANVFGQEQVTKYGDNVGTLDGIIKAYYDVVTITKGIKVSYERDSLLHVPGVRVAAIGQDQNGKTMLEYTSLKQYHKKSDAYIEKNGFIESEVDRKVEHIHSLWHVWSSYESRNTADGPVIERGTNSIELYFDGKRFWILGWFYD